MLLVRRSVSDLPGRVEIRSTKTGHIRKMALDSATLSVLEPSGKGLPLAPPPWAFRSIRTRTLWSSSPDGFSPLRPGGATSRFIALRNDLGLTAHPSPSSPPFRRHGDVGRWRRRPHCRRQTRHSRPTLTLQTYAHVMESTDRRAAEVVGGSISGTQS